MESRKTLYQGFPMIHHLFNKSFPEFPLCTRHGQT